MVRFVRGFHSAFYDGIGGAACGGGLPPGLLPPRERTQTIGERNHSIVELTVVHVCIVVAYWIMFKIDACCALLPLWPFKIELQDFS